MDPRNRKLARLLVHYSVTVKKGDKVWVDGFGHAPTPLIEAIVEEVVRAGGIPFYQLHDLKITRKIIEHGSPRVWKSLGDLDRKRMSAMDAYIAVRGQENIFQYAGVPAEQMQGYMRLYMDPVHIKQRVEKTKWVILRYPNPSFAQAAEMSDDDFADFFFRVCTLDYAKLSKKMNPLVRLMQRTKEIHIVGKDTDLMLNVSGQNWIKCDGKRNIPDGELFTSPKRTGVNGTIQYNTRTNYNGNAFGGIYFEVKRGKIVHADCESGNPKKLNQILNTDPGARYFGEFSFGLNPHIKREMLDILFDEKIYGSIHLTPGNAYKEAFNGNKSAVHWDLVGIGHDVYADGKLIRKGRSWVHPSLKSLNPSNF